MGEVAPGTHRAIVFVDVEDFSDRRRTNQDRGTVRAAVYTAVREAFSRSGITWADCHSEDRGDGMLILVRPEFPKSLLVTVFTHELAKLVAAHNRTCGPRAQMRLRLAVHAGEVHHDDHGVMGQCINLTSRLLNSDAARSALRDSPGVLALIVSEWFFNEVVRNEPASSPKRYRRVEVAAKKTRTHAWVCLPDAATTSDGDAVQEQSLRTLEPVVSGPQQLPAAVRDFVGRTCELDDLTRLLEKHAERGHAVMISVITGTAGVGKTALAIKWGHQVRDQFPDGVLYINLRGHDPDPAVLPGQALDRLLRALGVPAEKVPSGIEARADLYRSRLDGHKVLVLLDNAATVDQVRPLLPGAPGCAAVVTSRDRLSGLIVRDGAHPICLHRLSEEDAIALLRLIIGPEQVDAEPAVAAALARRCAYLPLALRVAAERTATHRHSTLSDVADELTGEQNPLDTLHTEDAHTAMRSVFSWSYEALPSEVARVFRLLALHPGPEISLDAAAALIDVKPIRARQLLDVLISRNLLDEPDRDRFRLHDLLRCYAAECAAAEESDDEVAAAERRVLDWYLRLAEDAEGALFPAYLGVADRPPRPSILTTRSQAQHWYETERLNLVAAVHYAADAGHHDIAWRLTHALISFFYLRKYWADWNTTLQIGLASARRSGDRIGEARMLSGLGLANQDHRFTESIEHYRHALPIFRATGVRSDEGWVLSGLGDANRGLRRWDESIEHYRQALPIFRETGNRMGEGYALIGLGYAFGGLRDFEQAIDCFRQVLNIMRTIDKRQEGWALHGLGYGYRGLRRFEESIDYYQQALTIFHEIGDIWGQGETLYNLGKAQFKTGRTDAARRSWTGAMIIFQDLNSRGEAEVRARIAACDSALAIIPAGPPETISSAVFNPAG
jgi:tetratricopeptide (TPR) repeat protein